MLLVCVLYCFFFFKQKTAYDMRFSDWSSDVRSSDLRSRRPNDPRAYGLAQLRVAHADDGDIGHVGMAVEIFLDFARADIFPAANDHVLRAAGVADKYHAVERSEESGRESGWARVGQ